MIGLLCLFPAFVVTPFKSKSRLEAENAALRHQLIVLRRKVQGRARLTNSDRWFFIQLYRWFPSILQVVKVVQPETLVRWHRAGFSSVLVLEVAPGWRAAADQRGAARFDPANEHREPALGSAAYPRRTAQARI
jgi:hypothetical protein